MIFWYLFNEKEGSVIRKKCNDAIIFRMNSTSSYKLIRITVSEINAWTQNVLQHQTRLLCSSSPRRQAQNECGVHRWASSHGVWVTTPLTRGKENKELHIPGTTRRWKANSHEYRWACGPTLSTSCHGCTKPLCVLVHLHRGPPAAAVRPPLLPHHHGVSRLMSQVKALRGRPLSLNISFQKLMSWLWNGFLKKV